MGSTTTTTNDFQLLPAVASDSPELVDLFDAAFEEDPNFKHFYPKHAVSKADLAIVRERDIKRYAESFAHEEVRWFKVVERNSGRIAAFAKWWYPHTKTPSRIQADAEAAASLKALKASQPPIQGANTAFADSFIDQLTIHRKKWIVEPEMYFLNILAVHPDFQRRGLGSMLIEPVLRLADRDGRKTYIEASKKGLRLYERYGWVRVGAVILDPRPFGGDGLEETMLLVRDPGTGKRFDDGVKGAEGEAKVDGVTESEEVKAGP